MGFWLKKLKRLSSATLGFSLVELIVVVATIGILAGLALEGYSSLYQQAVESAARDTLALMNRAVLHYNQSNRDLVIPSTLKATSDEFLILRTLQWRDPNPLKATPGSPYLPANLNAIESADPDAFRYIWNGRMFELLRPGEKGVGLAIDKESPMENSYRHPENYRPILEAIEQ